MDKKKNVETLETEKELLVHDMKKEKNGFPFSPIVLIFFSGAIIFGIGTGLLLARNSGGVATNSVVGGENTTKGTTVGSNDTKTFKDKAEGVLEEGGIEGEGQFHLVRPGGDSQNVYLISSTVDLSQFIKKKIRVWGETQKAQRAGWLMDVGRVEVL